MYRKIFAVSAAATALVLGLAACGAESAPPAQPLAKSTPQTEPPEPAHWSAYKVCETFVGDGSESSLLQRVPTALIDVGETMDQADYNEMMGINEELQNLIDHAPAAFIGPLEDIQKPFRQTANAETGGNLVLDTGTSRDATLPMVKACADAGYSVPGDEATVEEPTVTQEAPPTVDEEAPPAVEAAPPTTTPTDELFGEPEQITYTYTVSTTGSGISSVTYSKPGFNIAQDSNVSGTSWTKDITVDAYEFTAGMNMNAQNAGDGTISCSIARDGEVVVENSSSGPYAIVTCALSS